MRVALNGRLFSGAARGPRGRHHSTRSVSSFASVLQSSPTHFRVETRTRHFVLSPRTFVKLSRTQFFSTESNPFASNYRRQLQSSPHDAELARLVLEDLRQEGGVELSTFTASSIFETLATKGAVDDALEVLQYARTKGVQLDSGTLTTVFKKWYPAEKYSEVLKVWDNISGEDGFTESLFTTALLSAVQLKQSDRVFDMLNEVNAKGGTAGNSYAHVLGAACRTKQHQLVFDVFDKMYKDVKNAEQATVMAYHNTLRLAFKLGERDFVLELLILMGKQGVDPTEEYKSYMLSLHKMKSYDLLLEAFGCMRSAGYMCDEATLGAVVETTIRLGREELMFKIVDGMKENVDMSKVSTEVFPRAVRAALWKNNHQLVLKIFDYMHQHGADAMPAYTSAIRTAFKFKQYYFVLQVLEKMEKCGVDASGEYSNVVMSFRKVRRYDYLLLAFKTMRDLGYYQEEVLCTSAIMAAVKLDKKYVVFEICNGKDLDSKRLYSYALNEARVANKQDLVKSIMCYMPVERRVTSAVAGNDQKRVRNRFDVSKTALLEAHDKKKDVTDILDSMMKTSEDASDLYQHYLHVLRGVNKAKQHELVVAIAAHLAKNRVDLSVDMCTIILRSCARVNDLETALDVRSSMRRHRIAMTEDTTYSLIKCAAKAGQWGTVVDIMTELRKSDLEPTMTMYTMALNECGKQNYLETAVDIYERMPVDFRVKLSGRGLGRVILGHAKSSNKEIQLRGLEITGEHRGKKYKDPDAMSTDSKTTSTAKSSEVVGNDSSLDAASSSSKGVMGFFSSFFTK